MPPPKGRESPKVVSYGSSYYESVGFEKESHHGMEDGDEEEGKGSVGEVKEAQRVSRTFASSADVRGSARREFFPPLPLSA